METLGRQPNFPLITGKGLLPLQVLEPGADGTKWRVIDCYVILMESGIDRHWMDLPGWKMWICRGLTACVGLIGPATGQAIEPTDDPRHLALTKFFKVNDSPLTAYAGEFLKASDRHGLDWRLLPGLAMAESSGGKYFRNRNIFGWNSGETKFESVRSSIHFVASRLARSKRYAGKDLISVLRAYNPLHADYPERVLKHIRRMSPEPAPALTAQSR